MSNQIKHDEESLASDRTYQRHILWESLLAEDQAEVDLELLAAYAEGGLSPEERQIIRAEISRSPVAMEILDTLHEDLYPAESDEEDDEQTGEVAPAPRAVREERRQSLWVYATAASLLVAIGASYLAIQGRLGTGPSALLQREVALACAEPFLDPNDTLSMPTGAVSAKMLEEGLRRANSRSLTEPKEPVLPAAKAARLLSEGRERIIQAFPEGVERTVQLAALELAAGNAEGAQTIVERLTLKERDDVRVVNLEAVLLMHRADDDDIDLAASTKFLEQAEQLLKKHLPPSARYAPAWFNLAVVSQQLERVLRADHPTEAEAKKQQAADAWHTYLKCEPDPALRKVVEESLRTPKS